MTLKLKLILFGMLSICFLANAQPFRYIVAADGSGNYTNLQNAIDACPDNERSFILIKNGTYYGQTSIGTKAAPSAKIITLIGENRDSVILTYDKSMGSVATFELTTTFQIYAKNFYAENITFQNTAGNTGQALALYTAGDMSIFKNCVVKGYQDTYRSKKGTRGYFKDCWIEGAVDFIYAGGTIFFDDCTVNCIRSGGYICAPEDAYATVPKASTEKGIFLRLGFILRNCLIKGNNDVPANSFYLGRPWLDYAGAIYLNCKLSDQVSTAGWSIMGSTTYKTACFAEYNSMDVNGIPVDTTKRVTWSYQMKKNDVDKLLTTTAVYANNYTTTFDPITSIIQTDAPANLKLENSILSWDNVTNSIGYIIFSNGKYIGSTTINSFTLNNTVSNLTVEAINQMGVLSNASQIGTGIRNTILYPIKFYIENGKITLDTEANVEIYSLDGKKISTSNNIKEISTTNIHKGLYIIKIYDNFGNKFSEKVFL